MLSFHPNVNVKDGKEVGAGTPLLAATSAGNARMVKQLLKTNADPSILDLYGSTPLHICAKKGYAEIAQDIIQHCHVNKILVSPPCRFPSVMPLAWSARRRRATARPIAARKRDFQRDCTVARERSSYE